MKIISKEKIRKPRTVYNLHVKSDHNYIANGLVVKNCHAAKADILKKLLTQNFGHVPIRWGLTGTIPKEEFAVKSILVGIGEVINKISTSELQDKGFIANCFIYVKQLIDYGEFRTYAEELKYLVTNVNRVNYIANMINQIKKSGNTLVLVDRIKTGEILHNKLVDLLDVNADGPEVVFISGSVKDEKREKEYNDIKTSKNKIIIATYGIASTGINMVLLYNLILIEPGKSYVRVIQSIGRGLRKGKNKDCVNVYDICSNLKFSKRHLTKRKIFYNDGSFKYQIEKINYQ